MPKQFDNITRYLMGFDTPSWARFFGSKADTAELCNADLSTVTSQADAIILLGSDRKRALHAEIQASYDSGIGKRLVLYYALGCKALDLPLRSHLVLLRPEADGPAITGIERQIDSDDGSLILEFHYNVIRIWTIPAEELFESGLGILPLAFLGKINPDKLPSLVDRAQKRIAAELEPGQIGEFWTSIDILMGLRYKRSFVENLLKGVRAMKESVTYQAIVEEGYIKGEAKGKAKGAILGRRAALLRIGAKRFGPADPQTLLKLESIQSCDQLDDLVDRCLIVSNWAELLA